jgi:hypothetical protein
MNPGPGQEAATPDGPGLPSPTGHPAAEEAPSPTGHPAVDAALLGLSQVADLPPADQIPAYQAAHRTLRETLAGIDES